MDGLLEEIMGELIYMRIGTSQYQSPIRTYSSLIPVLDVITSTDTTAPYSEMEFSSLINSFNHLYCRFSPIFHIGLLTHLLIQKLYGTPRLHSLTLSFAVVSRF